MRSGPNSHLAAEHLSECHLLAYLDGELSAPEIERAKSHLKLCWTCRACLNRMEESIESFLDARSRLVPEPDQFTELRVQQFRQRLLRHSSESEQVPVSLVQRFFGGLRSTGMALNAHRQAAIAVLVIACLVTFMFTDALNTRVSADTVLHRAQDFDEKHLPQAGQVLRTDVRLDRVDRRTASSKPLGTITLVHDSATPSVFVTSRSFAGQTQSTLVANDGGMNRVLRPLLQEEDRPVEEYLEQQMWIPDLSVTQFRRLIGQRQAPDSSARKDGSAYELHFPFVATHPSGIQEVMLRVNSANYSADTISIVTTGPSASEYRFTRTLLSSEPRTAEMAKLFSAEPATLRAASSSSHPASAPVLSRPAPLSYSNTEASQTEVAISQALHNVDACLGEEVYIFPMSDGTLLVQGLVDSAARRQTIRNALRPFEGVVHVEVFLARELKSGSELYRPPDEMTEQVPQQAGSNASATSAELPGATMPLYSQLREHFIAAGKTSDEAEKQVSVFSNELVTTARQTFLHAWALRRLDHEFSGSRTRQLPIASLAEVDKLRQDHRRWISTLTQHQAEMLEQILPEASAHAMQGLSRENDTETILRLAQQQNELVRSLFTPSQKPLASDLGLQHLLEVLHRMGA